MLRVAFVLRSTEVHPVFSWFVSLFPFVILRATIHWSSFWCFLDLSVTYYSLYFLFLFTSLGSFTCFFYFVFLLTIFIYFFSASVFYLVCFLLLFFLAFLCVFLCMFLSNFFTSQFHLTHVRFFKTYLKTLFIFYYSTILLCIFFNIWFFCSCFTWQLFE